MKNLYLIGGTMGVGKTTLCRQLKLNMENAVFLDGDWCWDADPFQVTDETKKMVLDNICHLLNNFLKCSAYQNILFCWVMDRQEIIDSILEKIDLSACDVKVISLTVDEDTLIQRLAEDVKRGARTPDIINRSIARLTLYQHIDSIKIDTTGKTVSVIADEIVQLG